MVWNPLRLLHTLVHFQVGGPLAQGLARLAGVTVPQVPMDSPPLTDDLPTPPTVLLVGADPHSMAQFQDRLRGYTLATCTPDGALINTPLVVWLGSNGEELGPHCQRWAALDTYQEATLADFRQPNAIAPLWGSLDDGVMGGVSTSQVQWQDGLRFGGQVSTANNGGFASVRTRNFEPPLNLSQWQGMVLDAQGDGQRYKWILRDRPGWDSLAYCQSFDPMADRPGPVRIPFLGMVATRRARTVSDANPLNPAQIHSMQLMLSKFEYDGDLNPAFRPGVFGLTVQRLGVYRQAPKPVVVLPGGNAAWAAPLAAAGLTGVIPQDSGWAVIGSGHDLPPDLDPAGVAAVLAASHGPTPTAGGET
jgi:hypothetical protein